MIRVGLLSDTHGYLDPKIYTYFDEVDEIWHAGDVGSTDVIDELRAFKPTVGVYGNIDDHSVRLEFPEFQCFQREGVKILMTHIGGKPGKYSKPAYAAILSEQPNLFICGHSHILLVKNDPVMRMLCMNPGACGYKGFHQVKTLIRFAISDEKIHDLEVIEIGKRI